jgi:hypothetical protein
MKISKADQQIHNHSTSLQAPASRENRISSMELKRNWLGNCLRNGKMEGVNMGNQEQACRREKPNTKSTAAAPMLPLAATIPARDKRERPHWLLIAAEREDLLEGDVPLFHADPGFPRAGSRARAIHPRVF